MPEPNLTHDEKAVLAGVLRETIERDRFPLSPRPLAVNPTTYRDV